MSSSKRKNPVRPEVAEFALAMEHELRNNDGKGGWEEEEFDYLLRRLREETDELERVLFTRKHTAGGLSRVRNEAADVANFAMMISDNFKRLVAEESEDND